MASTLATSPATGLRSSVSALAASASATTPATWRACALAAAWSSGRAPARAMSYCALAAIAASREAFQLASASSRFWSATRPSRARPSTRRNEVCASWAAVSARCHCMRAISISCGRAPFCAFWATACAACSAAVACASLARTSGLSMRTSTAPAWMRSPSFTSTSATRAVTLPATSVSRASIWPWNTSGAGREARQKPQASSASTSSAARIAISLRVLALIIQFTFTSARAM